MESPAQEPSPHLLSGHRLRRTWEVSQDAPLPGSSDDSAFALCLVGEHAAPLEATAGMLITPRYTFADAPRPDADDVARYMEFVRTERPAPEKTA